MSGRKQHIVPRFLQVGFSKDSQTNVYSTSKKYTANIKDVFCERDFYSNQVDTTADEEITIFEHKVVRTYQSILRKQVNEINEVDPEISEMILHLFFRNKIIRSLFLEILCNGVLNLFAKNNLIQEISKVFKRPYVMFVYKELKNIYKEFEDSCKSTMVTAVTDGLNNIIVSDDLGFSKCLENTFYKIVETEKELLFSDTIILSVNKSEMYAPYPQVDFNYLFLPMSSNKLLVISKDFDLLNNFNIDINLIIKEFARSSSYNFISLNKNYSEYQKEIGQNSFYKDMKNEMEKYVENKFTAKYNIRQICENMKNNKRFSSKMFFKK